MIRYDAGRGELADWVVAEESFCPEHARKYEAVMCQGNGYMGVRAATEEAYERTDRCALVAGTFDRVEEKHSTELPDSADVTAVRILADGREVRLSPDNHEGYLRTLNLKNGLLERRFIWKDEGTRLECRFLRFVSLADRHVMGEKLCVKALAGTSSIEVETGIGGERRLGDGHFVDGEAAGVYGDEPGDGQAVWQYAERTHESGIEFVTSAAAKAWVEWETGEGRGAALVTPTVRVLRKSAANAVGDPEGKTEHANVPGGVCGLAGTRRVKLSPGQEFVVEKLVRVATTRDCDFHGSGSGREALLRRERGETALLGKIGWDSAFARSEAAWEALWETRDVRIEGETHFDQLAVRFAIYHLTIMAPLHDNRMNIGAKGLSGRGYLGHTFWDTEIYMLPYFIWTDPEGARSLLEHRYAFLGAARRKAAEKGYEGAMYPWQTAWLTDTETSVNQFMADYEHHVTADVAYGVYYYYEVTHDLDFMLRFGCEILFETAKFWCSRMEFVPESGRYEIRKVIGPDEYTHDADNNAFTNYFVHLNLRLAIEWCERLAREFPERYKELDAGLSLSGQFKGWEEHAGRLYLPKANGEGILPQDDTFLSLPEIDLSPYRAGVRKLKEDYPNRSYKKLQVAKQADVVVLFWLLEDLFPEEVKRNSFYYYEERCVHESSLSLCTYSILVADMGERETAYRLFGRAERIDLGEKMDSSDEGIHAASLGGVWQCAVLGFMGIRLYHHKLRIIPHLPDTWREAKVRIYWHGRPILVTASRSELVVEALDGGALGPIMTSRGVWDGNSRIYREVYGHDA